MTQKLQVLLTPDNHQTIDLTIEINESIFSGEVSVDFTAPQSISDSKERLETVIQSMYDTMEMLTDEPIDIEILIPEEVIYDDILDILITALAVLQVS
ncbi:hypothetical protein [Glutamicibacter ardleyensis]|uniref:hypothetical protein n=1 Tax=Glutamicibacter ardleyensis TaxID=225894 RepID=UPI003FCF5694